MKFRRWVVFTFAIHLAVVLIDKGGGFVLYLLTQDNPSLKGAADMLTTLPFVMMAVANLGLATSLVYYVRKGKHDPQTVAESTSAVALLWGGLVAAIAFPTIWFGVPWLRPEWELNLWLVLPLCLAVPFLLLTSYYNSLQLATERVRDYNFVHLAGSIAFLPTFLLVYWLLGEAVTEGIAIARFVVAVFLAGFVVWRLRKVVKLRPKLHWDFVKDGITFGWKANITSVLTYLNLRLNLYLIPVLFVVSSGSQGLDEAVNQVAFYSMALTFAELVWHFPEATRDLFFSKLAGSTPEQQRILTPILTRLCLAVSVVGGLLIYVVVDPAMTLISPENWPTLWSESVLGSLALLLPGTMAFTVAKILQNDLAARGRLNHCIVACASVTVTMLLADHALIPEQGARGAAIAMSIAYGVSSLYSMVAYRATSGVGVLECLIVRPSDWTYIREILAAVLEKIARWRNKPA